MGCNTPNCGQSPAAGAGVATAVPQDLSQCAGFAFCDPKLLALPKATAMNLVGVPDGDQCLKRISAKKGVWLHNPENPGGPDYVGGLDQIVVTGMGKLATTGCSLIPALRPTTDAQGMSALELVIASPQDNSKGTLGALNACGTNGGLRPDRIIPESLSGCPNNLSLLAFEAVTEIVDGQSIVNYKWYGASALKFPQGQVGELTGVDLTDTTNYRMAVFHKAGGCWVLKAADGSVFDGLCDVPFKELGDTDPLNVLACTTDGLNRVLVSAALLRRILGRNGLTRIDPVLITHQKTGVGIGGVISGSGSGTVDVTDHDIPEEATIAWVRVEVGLANISGTTNHIIATATINGEVVAGVSVDSGTTADVDRMSLAYPVTITDNEFTFSTSLSVSESLSGGCYAEIKLIGYE